MAITTSGIFSIIFIDEQWLKISTAVVGLISLFVSIYYETYDLRLIAESHKGSAKQRLMLRESLITLLTEINASMLTESEIKERLEQSHQKYFGIVEGMKDATYKAVSKASDALKKQEDNTLNDDEINSFLTLSLRK